MKRALVLAGGGVAGIAWELGVLRGLQDADPDLVRDILAADVVIGTSAGSAVAAQVTSGLDLDRLYADQLDDATAEIEIDLDMEALFARFAAATAGVTDPDEVRRRIGGVALDTETVPEEVRMVAIEARIPVPSWPDRTLLLPAVDAATGEPRIFDRYAGVRLVDAVAASCAVPGVWPAVTIGDRRYIDGGARSSTNADLAVGSDRILVITPSAEAAPDPFNRLATEIEVLGADRVHAVFADEASVAAFGENPLAPNTRAASARAGRAIGVAQAPTIAAFWR